MRRGGLGFLNAPHTHHAAHIASRLECIKMVEALNKDATSSEPIADGHSAHAARYTVDGFGLSLILTGVDVPGKQKRCELLRFDVLQNRTEEPLLRLHKTVSLELADQVYLKNLRVLTTE
jgi:hypothetical protein